jgi:hypothetical protein
MAMSKRAEAANIPARTGINRRLLVGDGAGEQALELFPIVKSEKL